MSSGKETFKTFYALSLAWQLGFLIVVPIGGFLFLGVLLDHLSGTRMVFGSIGALVGIGITVYEVYHLLAPLIKNDTNHD